MASKKKKKNQSPRFEYETMGLFLTRWRREKYKSALAMFKETKLSFSYKAYADFERGVALPSPEALAEIAQCFKKDPCEAFLVWVQAQMPSDDLKTFFSSITIAPTGKRRSTDPKSEENLPPSMDNTWVFGPRELEMLTDHPWLWDLCMLLVSHFPREVPFEEIQLSEKLSLSQLIQKYLKPWVDAGFIQRSETGLKLRYPYVHIPKTAEWNPIRKGNVRRAVDGLLREITPEVMSAQKGFRVLADRQLTEEQVRRWNMRVKSLEQEFLSEPEPKEEEKSFPYTVVVLLGPDRLKKL